MPGIDVDKIIDLGQNCFIVPSENHPGVSYVLDMCARYCSCPQGRCSGPCKHKLLVSSYKNISSFDVVPTNDPAMRKLFMYLGTGKKLELDWFKGLNDGAISESSEPQFSTNASEAFTQNEPIENEEVMNTSENDINIAETHETLERVFDKLKRKISSRVEEDPVGFQKALLCIEKNCG